MDNLQIKKLLVDFVTVKYPDSYQLFENLFNNEENLFEILKTIDANWIPTTETTSGLFTPEDKILLQQVANNIGVDLTDVGTLLDLKNVRQIEIPLDSSLYFQQDITNPNKVFLDIDKEDLFKHIEFDSNSYNSGISIAFNQGIFEIKSKNIIYISTEFKTEYEIPHNLGSNINVNVFQENDTGWEPVYAPFTITNNKVIIKFNEAVKCKAHLTII